MHDDVQLLRAYAETGSQAAFRDLVQRRLGLVYGTALRRVGGNAALAEEVAGKVFADLAGKARFLCRRPELMGWLFISARFAASDAMRSERRRRDTLEKAAAMPEAFHAIAVPSPQFGLDVDESMERLKEPDRAALLLRFYDGLSFAEMGRQLRVSEGAARMRVERALEKLRGHLARKGVTSTAAALAVALPLQAGQGFPSGLASSVASAALTGGATHTGLVALHLMSLTKSQVAAGLVAVAVAITGGTELVRLHAADEQTQTKISALLDQAKDMPALQAQAASLTREVVSLRAQTLARQIGTAPAAKAPAPATRATRRRFATLSDALASSPLYEAGALDGPPKPRYQPRPSYPFAMLNQGIEGTVTVDFVVGRDGCVYGARVVDASNIAFSDKALETVTKWIFFPGTVAGAAVNSHLRVPIVFTLNH